MTPKIQAHIETDPDNASTLNVYFVAEGVDPGHPLPLGVQDDIRLAREQFFRGGGPTNTHRIRDELRERLQNVIERHRDLGSLEYITGYGFLRFRDVRSFLAVMPQTRRDLKTGEETKCADALDCTKCGNKEESLSCWDDQAWCATCVFRDFRDCLKRREGRRPIKNDGRENHGQT